MLEMPTLSEVVALFNFIINKCDDGLAVLLGYASPPSALKIYELTRGPQAEYGVRIDGGEDVPSEQAILEAAGPIEDVVRGLGGWAKLTQALRDFRLTYPETWALIEMRALFVFPGGDVHDGKGGASAWIAQRFDGITAKTQRRRFKKSLRSVAQFVITHNGRGELVALHDERCFSKRLN